MYYTIQAYNFLGKLILSMQTNDISKAIKVISQNRDWYKIQLIEESTFEILWESTNGRVTKNIFKNLEKRE